MFVKAIETEYNGYLFRSRLEARWAVLFDALGVEYEYEKIGLELIDGTKYLPDFFIPNAKMFIEVKGNPDDEEGIRKARVLDDYPPDWAIMGCSVVGEPKFARVVHYSMNDDGEVVGGDVNDAYITYMRICDTKINSLDDYNNAVRKARQARFEFGRHGN